MNRALALILALYPMVAQADTVNAGPHRVRQNQVACQNTADFDDFQLGIVNPKAKGEVREAYAKVRLLYDHDDPRHQGRYCLTLRAGTSVKVEKRYGRYECVRFSGMPVGPEPRHNKCYWAVGISSYKDVPIPGVEYEWVY